MRIVALVVLAVALAAPGLASAQAAGMDKDVTCRFDTMRNMTVCDVRNKMGNARSAMGDMPPMTFAEKLRWEARESADRYVRKGQCDKALAKATADGDPTFIAAIQERCSGAARGAGL